MVNEGHQVGSRVGVNDCQIHKIDKMKVNCIITDLSSNLHIYVVPLVISGTYLLSNDSEQLPQGTIVIMSIDEFKEKHFLSDSKNSQVGIVYYFDPTLVIEKKAWNSRPPLNIGILYTALPHSLD